MPRLFFAIPIPIELRQKLLSAFSQKNFPGIRFTPIENLHITAHFLGTTSEEKIPEMLQRAKQISESTSSFELKLDSFKTIFQKKKPVMIWAQFEENFSYENLCLKLREAFPTGENRNPNPHATLARIKQLKQLPFEPPKAKSFSFVTDSLELFESLTHPEGAEYKLIERWKLK
ncbi:MAG TPA: RNA 2',3'-cyclic phosphodiesterase [Chitinophagales bacterium]|nr:RNA 2',3'-cyclic phosphodiesterase [Chitinophagales bacterium]